MSKKRINNSRPTEGHAITARNFVFACGPWLGKLFPDLLGNRIFPTRQEIFFFAPAPGDTDCDPGQLATDPALATKAEVQHRLVH